jgi:hypothetical protein
LLTVVFGMSGGVAAGLLLGIKMPWLVATPMVGVAVLLVPGMWR